MREFYFVLLLLVFVTSEKLAPTTSRVLDLEEREVALKVHNDYRKSLAAGKEKNADGEFLPKGDINTNIKYDSALAEKAKDWAKECLWEHTPGMTYGQNLFMFSRNMDVTTAVIMGVDNWWRELKYHFHGTDLLLTTERLEKDVGHWTMMAWDNIKTLGCAAVFCEGNVGNIKGVYLVCNYDTAQYTNQIIYGPPGSGVRAEKKKNGQAQGNSSASSRISGFIIILYLAYNYFA